MEVPEILIGGELDLRQDQSVFVISPWTASGRATGTFWVSLSAQPQSGHSARRNGLAHPPYPAPFSSAAIAATCAV